MNARMEAYRPLSRSARKRVVGAAGVEQVRPDGRKTKRRVSMRARLKRMGNPLAGTELGRKRG